MRIGNRNASNFAACFGIVAVALALAPDGARAGTNGFVVPSFRGSANSEAGYWEVFSVPVGAPGNLPDQPGATTDAVLTQTNTSAFLTGSGNIYNLSTSSFTLVDATPFTLGTVVLQTRTIGSELDYNSVSLIYSNGSSTHSLPPLFRYELNRAAAQGYSVSSLWQWNVSGLGITNYSISFNAAGPSMSFDSMTLDTASQFSKVFPEQPFNLQSVAANLARWMYAFNGNPASRPTASAFAAFGSIPDFDTRDAQYLLGWNTTNNIPAGKGAKNYLVRHARVTLTISSGNQYVYAGTLRDYRTYFPTNDPRYLSTKNTASPVELFGAGFRGGYTAATFQQDTTFLADPNGGYFTNRTAYAAGFDTNGALVDVSNNVGDDGTNELASPFEVAPFAVGQTTNVAPGQLMPVGSQLTFDLNLGDPLIYGYLQNGLNDGNLSFVASALVNASFGGAPNYPNFYTIFSSIASSNEYPLLDIEGEIVRTNFDSDGDGLPDDWENFYFGSLLYGATNDVDGDGVNNLAEYHAGTIPTAAVNVFRLLSIQHQTNATELHFAFAPGRQYSVQWSDDLQNWQTVTNPTLTYSSAWLAKTGTNITNPAPVFGVWRDTNATNQQRFYRVGAQ
jgi:hypothetical protein